MLASSARAMGDRSSGSGGTPRPMGTGTGSPATAGSSGCAVRVGAPRAPPRGGPVATTLCAIRLRASARMRASTLCGSSLAARSSFHAPASEECVAVRCPYCGERLETLVNLTADEPAYVEDCEVCCRPIEFHVERDDGGTFLALEVRRMD